MITIDLGDVLAFAAAVVTLALLLDRQSLLREMRRTRREVRTLRKALRAEGKPTRRGVVPPWMRQRIIERCNYQCQYCGGFGDAVNGPDGIAWHIDHVVPVSKGGPTLEGNLTLSCEACNLAKSDVLPVIFQSDLPTEPKMGAVVSQSDQSGHDAQESQPDQQDKEQFMNEVWEIFTKLEKPTIAGVQAALYPDQHDGGAHWYEIREVVNEMKRRRGLAGRVVDDGVGE